MNLSVYFHFAANKILPRSASVVFARALILLLGVTTSLAALDLSKQFLSYVAETYGEDARLRFETWQNVVTSHQDRSDQEKLKLVNNFFNQIKFTSDQRHWGEEDYWATPIEFVATNGGDCEDFSIAKYFTLRELGVSDEKLRITYVRAWKLKQAHMVLAYYETPEAEPVILDNLIGEIKPASERKDLFPIYSFNGDGLWLSKERGKGKKVGASSKLSRWSDLNQRFSEELKR